MVKKKSRVRIGAQGLPSPNGVHSLAIGAGAQKFGGCASSNAQIDGWLCLTFLSYVSTLVGPPPSPGLAEVWASRTDQRLKRWSC